MLYISIYLNCDFLYIHIVTLKYLTCYICIESPYLSCYHFIFSLYISYILNSLCWPCKLCKSIPLWVDCGLPQMASNYLEFQNFICIVSYLIRNMIVHLNMFLKMLFTILERQSPSDRAACQANGATVGILRESRQIWGLGITCCQDSSIVTEREYKPLYIYI